MVVAPWSVVRRLSRWKASEEEGRWVVNRESRLVGVVSRRNGRVIEGDTELGASSVFNVTAVLPVLESLDFAQEIRGKTSGTVAQPQLTFSHWEVLDEDPFWQPCTEEEVMLWGEKSDTGNRAMEYINTVRKRKGLPVREKVVERAEKQRTLSKTKR
ncbi:unnamed protein product [Cyprideis torosa]|uniref:Elongation factor EFG domain-containing protein n=1 Tax=Cyprideis torosa TaxID=163714 RepID=A0A7R8ZLQ9_9CRUS|nr:unnamed protein product [Cyprideis torosa]CAG0882746.1 unnamed protein product [Cyprideis torosa]